MSDTNQRAVAESVFERNQRRDGEINVALKLEAERHEAVIRNMHRLQEMRLARDAKLKTSSSSLIKAGAKMAGVRRVTRAPDRAP
jgi:hypothetical protein